MEFKLKKIGGWAKSRGLIIFLVFLLIFVFLIPRFALAQGEEDPSIGGKIGIAVARIISQVVLHIVNFLVGWLLTLLINALVSVAQYNHFIDSAAVSKGWIIVRDVFNMFFVVVLLVIAFSTVLKSEKYSAKRLLPSFLIAAVLVNFSKLICGIFIDFSQILMLTFISAIKEVADANLITMLGLGKLLSLNQTAVNVSDADVLGAVLLALVMGVVAVVVVGVITLVLIFRIVMIWLLVVLSPLAFMASVLESTSSYGKQWWKKFSSELIIGPVLAFMLWLSFATVRPNAGIADVDMREYKSETGAPGKYENKLTEAASPQNTLNFMIGIAMLVGSLMVAKELGVAGSNLAGNVFGKMQGMAMSAPLKGLKYAGERGVRKIESATGLSLRPSLWKDSFKAWQKRVDIKRDRARIEKAHRLGIPTPARFFDTYVSLKGGVRLIKKFAGRAGHWRNEAGELTKKRDNLQKRVDSEFTPEEVVQMKNEKNSFVKNKTDLEKKKMDLDKEFKTAPKDKKGDIKKQQEETVNELDRVEVDIESSNSAISEISKKINEAEKNTVSKKTKEKDREELKETIEKREEFISRAEAISPSIMPYEDRIQIQQAKMEEYKRIQDIGSWEELSKLYEQAKSRKEVTTMEAILMKLYAQKDGNEYLEKRGFEVSWQGLQKIIKEDFIKGLELPKEEANRIGNDISITLKNEGQFQLGCAYVSKIDEQGRLKFEEADWKDHDTWARVEAGKIENERFFRNLPRWSFFREGKDKDGSRIPLWDEYVKGVFTDKFDAIYSEIVTRGRMPQAIQEYLAHPEILRKLEENIKNKEISLDRAQMVNWGKLKGHLKAVQGKRWYGQGKEQGTKSGEGKKDESVAA